MTRSSDILIGTLRYWVRAAGSMALATAALTMPAAAAEAVPPDHTYEISGTPSVVRPGGIITFTGTCWSVWYFGASTDVNVSGSIRASSGQGPFDFSLHGVDVDPADGSYSGRITVPVDAPEGDYSLRGQCQTEDQILGDGLDTFRVEGDPLPTTTTLVTTTGPPTTSTHGASGPASGTSATPAIAEPGSATFTG